MVIPPEDCEYLWNEASNWYLFRFGKQSGLMHSFPIGSSEMRSAWAVSYLTRDKLLARGFQVYTPLELLEKYKDHELTEKLYRGLI